ncbi:DUF2971 domain-containing protein [Pseudomonas cichorii]|uniref:DUF2971 domain-containing protein n=1 Tax=Pseudomonas cichorii TaxID=36746 RepID=A0ABQ1DT27_PSECI|nr:DUF2971 domain-containing protein [Pseudomonas cichorii]AHF66110.1 hypothetical protein PCH70_09570 [Pseudomonas cichorii JBC1]QVE18073.1 DUF2971 domain-containing protein [Pseudomonas cichorii]GFM94068.1 hypothetical protein PSCICP_40400 [Pseudomonas cichorii]
MNRFLYKYMPLRPDFFKNPMIRATPALDLNDPFEGHFNKNQVRDADRNQREYYKKNGKEVYEIDDAAINDSMGVIQSELFDLGILSFTEDYNNPLMWAHYADNHKGVVVEFDFSVPFFTDSLKEVNGRKSRFGESYLADFFEFPEKVDYRREMPSFERSELSAPDSMNEFHWNKFNRTILFTKANDWIYEKEQRSIVQLKDADSIICNDNPYIRKQCTLDPSIELVELGNNKIQIIYPNEYEMHEEMGDQSIKTEIHFLATDYKEPAIHLFRINPIAISGVYFGCNATESLSLENIEKNSSLKHLTNIYKMRINDTQYQLNPSKLIKNI